MKIYKKNNLILDAEKISAVADRLKLPKSFIELLFLRGEDSEEKILKYLYSGQNKIHDPFLLEGMDGVVERIRQAADENQKVVVYCDYDADGICAGAIFSLFLSSIGVEVYTYVPSRSGDGYGLHIESLDRILEDFCPDLILTCDCGISCAAEVEHVIDLGVDIIVTDHHEIPQILPDCPTLNPHLKDCGYPFEHLCGAGVALKVVQAYLGDEKADEYLDMAAIATIADLVPLVDENRLIVQRGLQRIKKRTNLGISRMLDRLDITDITSMDVAFKIAPRINAAGRMGDASRALRLLISKDITEINSILDEIEADNNLRKQVCDELYNQAIADLKNENLSCRKAIVLSYPDWEKGITGIVAARLAGEFKRPSFIMVRSGEQYKGTARGIEDINIYKALSSASDLLLEFGGHEQAAGFSISENNIAAFKQRIDEYLEQFDESYFLPSCAYDLELTEESLTGNFVNALSLMEPFGNGNQRPLFCIKSRIASVVPLKSNPIHTQVVTQKRLSVMAFNFSHKNQILMGDEVKTLIIEAQTGGGGVRGLLRQAGGEKLYVNDGLAKANFIKMLDINAGENAAKTQKYNSLGEIEKQGIFGTLFIAGCEETYNKFMNSAAANQVILKEFIYSTTRNNLNRVIISPDFDDNLLISLYNRIVFLDVPLSPNVLNFIGRTTDAELFVPQTGSDKLFLDGIDLSRENFGRYFEAIRKEKVSGISLYGYFHNLSKLVPGLEVRQFVVCLMVFRELGLISVSKNGGFSVTVNKGQRAELTDSEIYRLLLEKGVEN